MYVWDHCEHKIQENTIQPYLNVTAKVKNNHVAFTHIPNMSSYHPRPIPFIVSNLPVLIGKTLVSITAVGAAYVWHTLNTPTNSRKRRKQLSSTHTCTTKQRATHTRSTPEQRWLGMCVEPYFCA